MTTSSELPGPVRVQKPFQSSWFWIVFVVGLDYVSSLAYIPSIASASAGRLAPLVMALVVFVTIFGAIPIYWYVAGRSPHGSGAIRMLEQHIPGWRGKVLVLILLGYAATDLVITRTFSSASAAEHMIHGQHPVWNQALDSCGELWTSNKAALPVWLTKFIAGWSARQLVVTLLILLLGSIVGLTFRKGFRRGFVVMAVITVGIYLLLNGLMIGMGFLFLQDHPQIFQQWWEGVLSGDWQIARSPGHPVSDSRILASCLELFPKVALGLSGFEMTMMMMPLIRGRADDDAADPWGRIRNTRKLLIVSAGLMCLYLIGTAFLSTLLIPIETMRGSGLASNRALSWLAYGGQIAGMPEGTMLAPFCGNLFGAIYDFSTVAILSLAGVTITISLASLVPPYLNRLGMEFDLSNRLGLLIYLFTAIKILITLLFRADVDDQRSAYTTSVLMIFTFAAFAVLLDAWHRWKRLRKWYQIPIPHFGFFVLFFFSTLQVVVKEPSGMLISMGFVIFLLVTSMLTRFYRSTEFRFGGFEFRDENSRKFFEKMTAEDLPILVPFRMGGGQNYLQKEIEIRSRHRIHSDNPLVFVIVEPGDPSEFMSRPVLEVRREEGRIVIQVSHCVSIPHAIVAIAVEMSRVGQVPELHFGWSLENPLTANLDFVLFGHGNVPWMVYTLLQHTDLPPGRRPRVTIA